MARLFVAIGGLIVLALTAALVAPYFVDWTSYRADFEREAGRILGRQVTVRGEATARLLPFPSVSFTDVAVAGVRPGETAMTVETFSMDAELAPFMRGDIHIFDMRLVRPQVFVDLAPDGALDWAVRPSVPVDASHISLEKLTVTEGRVELRHAASGRTHRLTEVNADISARALTGPWRMDGSLRLDGMKIALGVSTGQADGAGGMRLRVQARPERYALTLESDGNARIEDGRALYSGQFRLNAPVASDPAAPGESREPPLYRLSGSFNLDHAALTVDAFRFETGTVQDPYVAEGNAAFDLGAAPRFLVRADGAQIRFGDDATQAGGRFDLRQRLAGLNEFLIDAPRPTIPGRIEIALPAVVAGDTTARDVHLFAEPSETGWSIASLGGTLPGRTTLEASGELAVGEALRFDGSLLLAVGQPSGFAAWLARDVDDAIRRLPAAGFSADVALSPESQIFSNLELVLGEAKFRGKAESRTPAGLKPSLALTLDGDSLDVEGMAAFASLFVGQGGEARLAERDVELEITAGPVSAAGLEAETLDTALRLKDGRLEIDRLAIGGLAGANISATGTLGRLSAPFAGEIDASLISADLEPLFAVLAARFPQSSVAGGMARRAASYPGLLEDATIQVKAHAATEGNDGETKGVVLDVSGEAGGTAFTLAATAHDPDAAPMTGPIYLNVTVRNDDAAALYTLFGLPALPLGMAGLVEVSLSFDGVPEQGGKTRLTFAGEGLNLVFSGDAGIREGALSASGEALVESDDIEPWLATAGIGLPGFGLGLPVKLESQLDIDDGLLVLSALHGQAAGSALSGDINAQLRDGLPHLTGAVALGSFDLALAAELATGPGALDADLDGSWPDGPFASSVAMPFTAELDLSAEQMAAGRLAEARDARMTLKVGRDGVAVADLQASVFGGQASGIVDFRNDAGTGLFSAQLRLISANAPALLGDAGLTGTADLTASLTASGKSVDGVIAALSGSGTVSMRDLTISGVAPDVFPDLIVRADAVGAEIDAGAVAEFVPPLVRAGSFASPGVDIAFTVVNGAVRAPPFRLETQGAALAGEVTADLSRRTVGAEATLTFDPGHEAVAGSEPAVRFSASGPTDALRVDVDTVPMAQFLTQRALELEQQRVEAMQAALIEKQRLRREARYYAALDAERQRAAEEARRAAEEAQRLEQERLQHEEEERLRQEEAERQRLEEAARAEAERQRREEELRRQEEERRSEEETRLRQARQQAAEADAERQRREDEQLRDEVEALLRAREAAPVAVPSDRPADGVSPVEGARPGEPEAAAATPEVVPVTPMPAPRDALPAEAPPAPVPQLPVPRQDVAPAPDASAGGGLSIDGLMRAIGIGR